ncbi:MAG: DUF2452 domain-containing protein [Gammaproteobacteria bacterium]|nr:DUF2452 domain-containing protein [Gammaproteobacteria bacterium]
MTSNKSKGNNTPEIHKGAGHSAPYPVSRLGAAVELVDLARQIQDADQLTHAKANAKLRIIADQIRVLQNEARKVLEDVKQEQDLHRVQCNFPRKPGQMCHLYRKPDGKRYFSLLSPEDWNGTPPHDYLGSFRLEADMSWTPLDKLGESDNSRELVNRLLAASFDPER